MMEAPQQGSVLLDSAGFVISKSSFQITTAGTRVQGIACAPLNCQPWVTRPSWSWRVTFWIFTAHCSDH